MSFEKNTSVKNAVIASLLFMVVFGLLESFAFGLKNALIAAPIAALFFGLAIYFFSKSRKINKQTELEGINENELIYFGLANHFKGVEAVGGKLYLLPDRLVFKSHNFNIQNHRLDILLTDVQKISYYKTLGIIPNGMELTLSNGSTEKFVVNNRNHWEFELKSVLKKVPQHP
ncbi:hypothetical protein [Pedobacter sp. MW01-1-1]|uniref:hypothetical protein n=1 Tax=Pedobacter sp. MW01-1-1 TaxID=3383027 RepID=UPI003FEE7CF5